MYTCATFNLIVALPKEPHCARSCQNQDVWHCPIMFAWASSHTFAGRASPMSWARWENSFVFLGLCFNTFYVIEIELDYLRNYVTGITFTSLWLSLITQTFLAEVVWLGWITFTYSWPSLIKCACFCWAWSPLRRYDWPRSLLFLSLNLITFTPVPASLFTFAQYNCTVQPLSPLQGLLDQKGGGGGRTALCLVSMLSVAWLLSHFCYRNHLHIFMAEIDHFHFF